MPIVPLSSLSKFDLETKYVEAVKADVDRCERIHKVLDGVEVPDGKLKDRVEWLADQYSQLIARPNQ